MMRPDDCRKFAAKHGLCIISIADLCEYRKARDPLRVRLRLGLWD